MSDIIQLLPDSVANQIAAGEVIQRPASVIKELVENAVDAGAKHIDVLVVDAGRTSIQVIDDGKGMSETDARLAFERHATSKIRQADDLFALRTMGFRGEALPSIVAVSQVDLQTRTENEEVGTHLTIAGSRFQGQEPCACPVGANFLVENLFYNVPARRKFLKSNATELNNIIAAFERIALVYNDINFTLRSNGAEVFNLKATNLHKRIIDIFGRKLDKDLLPVREVETSICTLQGFVGKPESSKKKCNTQYFFVNGRYMRHPYFHKAVISAFDRLIPTDEQVPYFFYFTVRPEDIDVNIHPTKTEIKFENEQAIWQILSAAVKETLGRFNAVPSIDFDTEGMPDIPAFEASPYSVVQPPKTSYDPSYNPFDMSPLPPSSYSSASYTPSSAYAPKKPATSWEPLFHGLEKGREPEGQEGTLAPEEGYVEDASASMPGEPTLYDALPKESVVEKVAQHYQYKGSYILTSVKSGLMIIDQQRAHIRILYDQYMAQIEKRQSISQRMLFPDMVHFSPAEVPVLEEIMEDLKALGFDLSSLGGGTYAINGIPSGIEGLNPETLVTNMVQTALEKGCKVKEEVQSLLALSLAKAAAIVPGQVLTNEEMNNLVDGLFAVATPNYTPDGKTVLSVLKEEDLEKLFK